LTAYGKRPTTNDQRPTTDRCILCYITDRTAFAQNEDEPTRRRYLLEKIAEVVRAGVDYIQLREKDLPTRDLESLAREAVRIVQEAGQPTTGHWPLTTLLINSRTDIALAVGADGVHLRSDDISPQEVRRIWQSSCGCGRLARENSPQIPLVGVSCHSAEEVTEAAAQGTTFAVFAPVFEKKDALDSPPAGLAALQEACRNQIPVLALGGVNLSNARSCLAAGAAGIAAIRLFQENNIEEIVRSLRT
jgi:thiamine-phosphate pyrophosphorylase